MTWDFCFLTTVSVLGTDSAVADVNTLLDTSPAALAVAAVMPGVTCSTALRAKNPNQPRLPVSVIGTG